MITLDGQHSLFDKGGGGKAENSLSADALYSCWEVLCRELCG